MGAVSGWMLVNESEKMVMRMRSRRDGTTCFTMRQTKGSVGRWAGRIARVWGTGLVQTTIIACVLDFHISCVHC